MKLIYLDSQVSTLISCPSYQFLYNKFINKYIILFGCAGNAGVYYLTNTLSLDALHQYIGNPDHVYNTMAMSKTGKYLALFGKKNSDGKSMAIILNANDLTLTSFNSAIFYLDYEILSSDSSLKIPSEFYALARYKVDNRMMIWMIAIEDVFSCVTPEYNIYNMGCQTMTSNSLCHPLCISCSKFSNFQSCLDAIDNPNRYLYTAMCPLMQAWKHYGATPSCINLITSMKCDPSCNNECFEENKSTACLFPCNKGQYWDTNLNRCEGIN